MAKRTMVMDGNFLMHRFSRDYTFIEFPEDDMNAYKMDLANHISAEIDRVKEFVDNIIMVKDARSWRKDVEQIHEIQPLTGTPVEAINYKENRKGSDEGTRNDALLFQAFNEFTEVIERDFGIAVTQVSGAEGDDAIWAWTKHLRENNIFSCVYCSDSDIIQTVTPSNSIIRRIRSKKSQDGEIIIHPTLWKQMNNFINDPFNFNPLRWRDEKNMIGQRTIDSGLRIENPAWTKLKLIILGSGKDNVLEIFNWPSNTGTQTRHIGEKHVIMALDLMGLDIDSITEKMLYDDTFLNDVYFNLVACAKPKNANDNVTVIFESLLSFQDSYIDKMKSNRKMGLLNTIEIPQTVQDGLFEKIKAQSNMRADFKMLGSSKNIHDAMNVTNNKMFRNFGV